MNRGRAAPGFFLPAGHEHDAGAEQHGEDGHELLIGQHVAEKPDPVIRSLQVAVGGGILVRRQDHGEALNIHDQDAEQRESAQHVNGLDAVGLGHSSRARRRQGFNMDHLAAARRMSDLRGLHVRKRRGNHIQGDRIILHAWPPSILAVHCKLEMSPFLAFAC